MISWLITSVKCLVYNFFSLLITANIDLKYCVFWENDFFVSVSCLVIEVIGYSVWRKRIDNCLMSILISLLDFTLMFSEYLGLSEFQMFFSLYSYRLKCFWRKLLHCLVIIQIGEFLRNWQETSAWKDYNGRHPHLANFNLTYFLNLTFFDSYFYPYNNHLASSFVFQTIS